MITHKVFRPVYRLLQHAMVLESVSVMISRTADISALADVWHGVTTLTLDRHQLRQFIDRGQAPHCEALADRLIDPKLTCVGATVGEKLLSFAWFHQGRAEGAMNHGRSVSTATPMLLEQDAAFVFHAYTAPEARGRGLLATVLAEAATVLREQNGVRTFVTTTESVNDAALNAFRRAGFRDIGTYWRFGVGKRVYGRYPRAVEPIVAYNMS